MISFWCALYQQKVGANFYFFFMKPLKLVYHLIIERHVFKNGKFWHQLSKLNSSRKPFSERQLWREYLLIRVSWIQWWTLFGARCAPKPLCSFLAVIKYWMKNNQNNDEIPIRCQNILIFTLKKRKTYYLPPCMGNVNAAMKKKTRCRCWANVKFF